MIRVKPNIGIINALIRITIGLTLLSWCTSRQVRKPHCQSSLWLSIAGAMKVAEGIVRFCPVTAYFEQTNLSDITKKQNPESKSEGKDFEETVPINPS